MSKSFTDNINCFNVSNVSNVSNHYAVAEDRSEILTWLSPLEPRIRHQDLRTRRADNVGEWLLRTDEFQRWCNGSQQVGSEHAALFCCGGPAVGKTYLSSLVVDRLCDKSKEQNTAVACFYVDFAAREEQSPTNMLGSLLKQIVGGLEKIPDEIREKFQDYKKVIGGRGPRVSEIVEMLQTVTSLQPTFICVDALDECVERHRPEVLDSLRQILEKSSDTRIFLTGRRHIRGEIDKHLGGRTETLLIKPHYDDIVGYIQMRLNKDTSLDAMDSGLEAEIIKSITENIPETFLLISLTMDAILGEPTAYGRRQKLGRMTEGLDLNGVYGATLERVKEQGGEKARLGMAALMWISHSEKLLQLDELSHALAIEIGSKDLNSERIPSVGTLLSCCLGLIVVDREASTIHLIHFTLQEYLYTYPNLFGSTHSIMAETCLTYLNFQAIKDISSMLLAPPEPTPFLKYSSLYWGVHAKRETTNEVASLALQLFSQVESHISTRLLLADLISRTGRYSRDIPISGPLIGFTGLHCASAFGIAEIATALIDRPNCDLGKRDFLGITPLVWAAMCGHEGVAKLLLQRQTVNPDKPDGYFRRTALAWAAGKGHEGIVRLLLCRASTRPDGTDGWRGKMPQVMNMVRGKRYINPNRPDKYGQTPILLAASGGHEGVVQLLLGRKDVNPDAVDGYGYTPLLCASSGGHSGVVELLLEREDVNINKADKNGQTSLLLAAESGSARAVGLLLEQKNINLDTHRNADQTPLLLASMRGHDGVVRLLLGRGDVNPDIPDNDGRTPLSWAAGMGRGGVVELLLGRGDVNPNIADNDGRTPLSRAAMHGHEGVVGLLLGREDVNPNMADNDGRAPLSLAAENGHEGAAKLLLGREDVNPNMANNYGRTPLSLAAKSGRESVVKLLLGREDVNPNIADNGGQTPLSLAAENGRAGAVNLLLGRKDVNPSIASKCGRTPLSLAAEYGREGAVKLLLGREDVNPNIADQYGQTPLSLAAGGGRESAVKLLLGRADVNPNVADSGGRTPFLWAAMYGHERVVKLLLEREDVNPDTPNCLGRTPLSVASENRHEGVVKLLQARKSANPNID